MPGEVPIDDLLAAAGFPTLGQDPPGEAVEAVLRRLRGLLDEEQADPLRRAVARVEVIQALKAAGIPAPARLVDAALGDGKAPEGDGSRGERPDLSDPEPWPEPVEAAELLAQLAWTFARYVVLPEGAATALALWVLHAHAHDAAQVSPILMLTSPEKRCGKTTLLTALSALVPRPLPAANVTPSALFRAVEAFRPTVLVDEADAFLRENDELRGILNSGHYKAGAKVVRSVVAREDYEPRVFSTWCPKAISLIGKLPATLEDRAILIRMRRKRRDERVERLRLDRLGDLEPLRRKAFRWARDHLEELRNADPEVPDELHDRAQDNWRPLIALADVAGGVWPERARQAARVLSGAEGEDEGSNGVLLLADIRDLFRQRGVDRITSAELVEALREREDRLWPEWRRGQPITARGVAGLLAPFGIRPQPMDWGGAHTKGTRGYRAEDFRDAWSRYLPEGGGAQSATPQPSSNDADNRHPPKCNLPAQVAVCDAPKSRASPTRLRGCGLEGGSSGRIPRQVSLFDEEEER